MGWRRFWDRGLILRADGELVERVHDLCQLVPRGSKNGLVRMKLPLQLTHQTIPAYEIQEKFQEKPNSSRQ